MRDERPDRDARTRVQPVGRDRGGMHEPRSVLALLVSMIGWLAAAARAVLPLRMVSGYCRCEMPSMHHAPLVTASTTSAATLCVCPCALSVNSTGASAWVSSDRCGGPVCLVAWIS